MGFSRRKNRKKFRGVTFRRRKAGESAGPLLQPDSYSYEEDDVGWGVIVMRLPVVGDDFASADRSSQSHEHTLWNA